MLLSGLNTVFTFRLQSYVLCDICINIVCMLKQITYSLVTRMEASLWSIMGTKMSFKCFGSLQMVNVRFYVGGRYGRWCRWYASNQTGWSHENMLVPMIKVRTVVRIKCWDWMLIIVCVMCIISTFLSYGNVQISCVGVEFVSGDGATAGWVSC